MESITLPIQHFSLAGVDLNLLVVFDALMTEQHLTRAAEKIGLSQPATSNALARLRKLFKDDLFIKVSRGMTPTPRAIALVEPIRQALGQIQVAVAAAPAFDPESSDRLFRLAMDDYTEIVFLPKLLQAFKQRAPQARIQVRSSTRHRAPGLLDDDQVDIALGYFPNCSPWHSHQNLYDETFVCLGNARHFPNKPKLSMETYLAAPHLLVSPKEDMVGAVDGRLSKQGLSRNVVISVPNFLIVPFVLGDTNLIATLPSQIGQTIQLDSPLKVFPVPFDMKGFSIDMLWHRKYENDGGNQWLRQLVVELCPTL